MKTSKVISPKNISINSIKVHNIESYSPTRKLQLRLKMYLHDLQRCHFIYKRKLNCRVGSRNFTVNVSIWCDNVKIPTAAETNEAEFWFIKLCHVQYYPEIVSYFADEITRVTNLIYQLKFFDDNGIIRSAGGLKHT